MRLRQLYIAHPYYPEYKARTDNPLYEDYFQTWIQFLIYHAGLGLFFVFIYFAFLRWLPKAANVNEVTM